MECSVDVDVEGRDLLEARMTGFIYLGNASDSRGQQTDFRYLSLQCLLTWNVTS
jgi:hypothetical protein